MKKLLFLSISLVCFIYTSNAQIFNKLKKAKTDVTRVTVDKLSKDPVTTSFKDVDRKRYIDDTFGNDRDFNNIHQQPFDSKKGFRLTPGFYEGNFQSFCIKAGTYAPSEGNARLYAELKGPKADIVNAIVKGHHDRSDIRQREVQLLLWAIIAKTDFQRMPVDLKATAVKLLSPEQIARLSKGALDDLGRKELNQLTYQSEALRTIIEAENKMRSMYYSGVKDFKSYEDIAIRAGAEPLTPEYQKGRWSKHPDGYYVRYFPSGYSKTMTQIYVPDKSGAVFFDGVGDIAVPAATSGQRLLQTNIPVDANHWPGGGVVVSGDDGKITKDSDDDNGLACIERVHSAVDAIILDEMVNQNITGMAVGVIQGDRFIHLKGYGYQDLDHKRRITHNTVLRWASISKPLTAVSIFQLAQNNTSFTVNDLVTTHLSYWPSNDSRGNVTIQHLLNNRSGVTQYGRGKMWNSCAGDSVKTNLSSALLDESTYTTDTDGFNGQSAVSIFSGAPLDFNPGSQYMYSSYGFNLLGAVVDQLSPNGYVGWVMDSIAGPLNMTTLAVANSSRTGFHQPCDGALEARSLSNMEYKLPGGGWESTICDLGKFAEGLMNGKLLPNNSNALWTGPRTNCSNSWNYISGIYQDMFANTPLYYHGGDHSNLTTDMEFYPGDSLAVVLMIPTRSKGRRTIAKRIFNAFGKTWNVSSSPDDWCSSSMESCNNRFSGVWHKTGDDVVVRVGFETTAFNKAWNFLRSQGYYCFDFEAYLDEENVLRWDGVFKKGSGSNPMWRNFDQDDFNKKWQEEINKGNRLIDLETYLTPSGKRKWAGLFRPGTGKYALWRNFGTEAFAEKREQMAKEGRKLIDIEVYVKDGKPIWSGVWVEGQDGLLNRNYTTEEFGELRSERRKKGYILIDIESYVINGTRLWAGIWEKSTNREGLYRLWEYCDIMDKHHNELSNDGYELIDWERD